MLVSMLNDLPGCLLVQSMSNAKQGRRGELWGGDWDGADKREGKSQGESEGAGGEDGLVGGHRVPKEGERT